MVAEIKIDFTEFDAYAQRLAKGPQNALYAASRTLNDSVELGRQHIIEFLWPRSVNVRSSNFMNASLTTFKSTKHDLVAGVYDRLGHANLSLHDKGGTKFPARGRFAIPLKGTIKRGSHGVVPSQRPAALIAATPKRALRITQRGIFVGKGGSLHLKYSFKSSAYQPADVDFSGDFAKTVSVSFGQLFPSRLMNAIASSR